MIVISPLILEIAGKERVVVGRNLLKMFSSVDRTPFVGSPDISASKQASKADMLVISGGFDLPKRLGEIIALILGLSVRIA